MKALDQIPSTYPVYELYNAGHQLNHACQSHIYWYTGYRILPNRLEVTSTTADCVMDGSHQVKQLGLHERYNVDVSIILKWNEGPNPALMETDGNINVEVFSYHA